MTVTVFKNLISISIDFFTILFFLGFSFNCEDISNTKTVFDHISKHLKVRQKYSAERGIFNSLLGLSPPRSLISLSDFSQFVHCKSKKIVPLRSGDTKIPSSFTSFYGIKLGL